MGDGVRLPVSDYTIALIVHFNEAVMLEELVTWAEIDLDAIAHNVRAFQHHVGEVVEIIAVVKANAYGHGAVPVAQAALAAGATRLAVHRATEGVELRQAGIEAPILVMGYTPPAGADMVARWRLTPSLITAEFASALSARAGALGLAAPVHVKVDTGMNRLGLSAEEVAAGLLDGLEIITLMSHLACADEPENPMNARQRDVLAALKGKVAAQRLSLANSAGVALGAEYAFDLTRPGLSLYGGIQVDALAPHIRQIVFPEAQVVQRRAIGPGDSVGYGGTFVATRDMQMAILNIGYADGYFRGFSGCGRAFAGEAECPVNYRGDSPQKVEKEAHIPAE